MGLMRFAFPGNFRRPIRPIVSITPIPISESGAGHALAQAALFEKIFLQATDLLVNQVVGLVNKADGDVGDHRWRAGLTKLPIVLVGLGRFAAKLPDLIVLSWSLCPR